MNKNIITTIMVIALSNNAMAKDVKDNSKWDFSAEIYGLVLNIDGKTQIADMSSTNLDVSPDLILDSLDMGLMFHTEGLYDNKYGYSLDYSFMDLSNGKDVSLVGNKQRTSINANVFQGVLESKVFRRYQYNFGTIDYMAGIRWWETKADGSINIGGTNKSGDLVDASWVDYVVGARYITQINEDFNFYFNADIGAGKDTDLTYQIITGVRHPINKNSELNFGYKSTWVDYDTKEFKYDTQSHGLMVGYNYSF